MKRWAVVALAVGLAVACLGCVDLSKPRAWACTDNSGCSTGWFCAADGYCHDQTKGESLQCTTDADCGGGFHCGAVGRCYQREDAGATECRRLDGGAPLFAGGDCADGWRCGIDNHCHIAANAGAIGCRYGIDSDCTDGWRCGFAGRCVDPAGEQQQFGDAGVSAPQPRERVTPFGQALAISQLEPIDPFFNGSTPYSQTVLLAVDGGQLALAQKLLARSQNTTTYSFASVGAGSAQTVTQYAVDPAGAWLMRSGAVTRFFVDGGETAVLDEANQPLTASTVTQFRPFVAMQGLHRAMAFAPASAADPGRLYFLKGEGGGAYGLDAGVLAGLYDAMAFPLQSQQQNDTQQNQLCWVRVSRFSFNNAQASVSIMRGHEDLTASGCGMGINFYQPGDLRVGANGIIGWVDRTSFGGGSTRKAPGLRGADYSVFADSCRPNASPRCEQFSCQRLCATDEEELADFVPWRESSSSMGFDVACRSGQGVRWARLTVAAEGCVRRSLSQDRELFLGGEPQPALSGMVDGGAPKQPEDVAPLPLVTPGGYYRTLRRDGHMQVYGGASAQAAVPWFNDRVPALAIDLSKYMPGFLELTGPDISSRVSPFGFVAEKVETDSVFRIISRIEGDELMAVSSNGAFVRVLENNGQLAIQEFGAVEIAPEKFVEPVRAVISNGIGRRFMAVSVQDTLYTDLIPTDGGSPRPQPVVAPSPGQPIIAIADGAPDLDAGVTNSVWLATRFAVDQALRTASVGWRSVGSGLSFAAPVVKVWNGQTAGGGRTARVGLTTGTVMSLPSGLTLAPAFSSQYGDAQDFRELCGQLFAVSAKSVLRLKGDASWETVISAPDLIGSKLLDGTPVDFSTTQKTSCTMFVVNRFGDVWSFVVQR